MPDDLDKKLAEFVRSVSDAAPESKFTISRYLAAQGIDDDTDVQLSDSHKSQFKNDSAHSKYEVGDKVAEGGMGAILDARDLNVRRHVAMKVMHDSTDRDSVLRFIEEAQVTAQLEHPNIVPVHELGINERNEVFYSMKFVHGITLQDALNDLAHNKVKAVKKYPLGELLIAFQKACDAIAFAHSKGVIHRDLKPENIMLGDYGEVLVMDWGLAKIMKRAEPAHPESRIPDPGSGPVEELPSWVIEDIESVRADGSIQTMSGSIMGTPGFMAPEQALGHVEDMGPGSDIYALGAILYNILTLAKPIDTSTIQGSLLATAQGDIHSPFDYNFRGPRQKQKLRDRVLPHTPNNEVPRSLAAVAMKALSLEIDDRYDDVTSMQADIEKYQNGFATSAESASLMTSLGLLVKRNRTKFTAAAAGIAVIGLVLAGFARGVQNKRDAALAEEARITDVLVKIDELNSELEERLPEIVRQNRTRTDKLMTEGEWKKAIDLINTTLDLSPTDADTWLLKAQIELGRGEFQESVIAFETARRNSADMKGLVELEGVAAIYAEQHRADADGKSPTLTLDVQWQLLQKLMKTNNNEIALHRLLQDVEVWRPTLRHNAQYQEWRPRGRLARQSSWKDGTLTLRGGTDGAQFTIPTQGPNYAIRATVAQSEKNGNGFKFRGDMRSGYHTFFVPTKYFGMDVIGRGKGGGKGVESLGTHQYAAGESVRMRVNAVGPYLSLTVDSQEIVRADDKTHPRGLLRLSAGVESTGVFSDVELLNLGDPGSRKNVRQVYFSNNFSGWTSSVATAQLGTAGQLELPSSKALYQFEGVSVVGERLDELVIGLTAPFDGEMTLRWQTTTKKWQSTQALTAKPVTANGQTRAHFDLGGKDNWRDEVITALQISYKPAAGDTPLIIDYIIPVEAPE
jgi:serine/threonine protein kinase